MRRAFADTAYWIARALPRDQEHDAARDARESLGAVRLVTTEEVLTEFLNKLGNRGTYTRSVALTFATWVLESPEVDVIAQSHHSFLAGLELYGRRKDKGYSLTDCISMALMHEMGIREVLTQDGHFRQEGFVILMED